MTLGSRTNPETGQKEFLLVLTGKEIEDFKAGRPVVKESGDAQGTFTVTAQLTRPPVALIVGDQYAAGFNNTTAQVEFTTQPDKALRFTVNSEAIRWAERYLSGYHFDLIRLR